MYKPHIRSLNVKSRTQLILARLAWLILEAVAILAVGMLFFGIDVRGSWLAFIAVNLIGAMSFCGLGLLAGERQKVGGRSIAG